MEGGRSWSIESYLNEYFDIPAKNPPGEARRRWRRAVGLIVRNRRRRFGRFSDVDAIDEAQRRKILVRTQPLSLPGGSPFPIPAAAVAPAAGERGRLQVESYGSYDCS